MMKMDIKLVTVLPVSAQAKTDLVFKMDVLLIHIVKFVMMQEELPFVFNVSLQLTDFLYFHNINAFANKDSMTKMEFVNHAHQAVLSVQTLQFVKDVLSLPPTIITDHVLAHKVIISLFNH